MKENDELKSELSNQRENTCRLKSNVLVYEKRNQAFHDTPKRLEEEDAFNKETYARRKDSAYGNRTEHASKLQRRG
eukprot:scaffold4917_cov172-Amphora_coffeaeformis.AAC.2